MNVRRFGGLEARQLHQELHLGPVGDGLLRLHESIRLGFNYQMADVTRADFRHRVPDMIIGAIAEVESIPIVTANPNDFVSYFPAVQLIKP